MGVQADTTLYAYAAIHSPTETGSVVQSDVTKKTYVVEKETFPMNIFINEVYPSPAKGEEEWIELWNSGEEDVSLAGWQLDDVKESGSKAWVADTKTTIPAHGFLVLPSTLTKIAFNNGGDDVRLLTPTGRVVDAVTYPKMKTATTYARNIQAQSFCTTMKSTPGEVNQCVVQHKVLKKAVKSKYTANKNSIVVPSGSLSGAGLYGDLRAQITSVDPQENGLSQDSTMILILSVILFILLAFWAGRRV